MLILESAFVLTAAAAAAGMVATTRLALVAQGMHELKQSRRVVVGDGHYYQQQQESKSPAGQAKAGGQAHCFE